MTVGKVTKKDSRLFSRTYKFMRKSANNLTLKDFAELIDFMTEADERINHTAPPQPESRVITRPVLGLGHFLGTPSRLTHPVSQIEPTRNNANAFKRLPMNIPKPPEKKKDADRNPLEQPGSRHSMEIL